VRSRGIKQLLGKVETGIRRSLKHVTRACPYCEVLQRHYRAQRSVPAVDARLEFDLRTAVGERRGGVKLQPQWMEATVNALKAKRSNLQVAVGASIEFGDPRLRSKAVLDVIAAVWIACRPWINAIVGRSLYSMVLQPRRAHT